MHYLVEVYRSYIRCLLFLYRLQLISVRRNSSKRGFSYSYGNFVLFSILLETLVEVLVDADKEYQHHLHDQPDQYTMGIHYGLSFV